MKSRPGKRRSRMSRIRRRVRPEYVVLATVLAGYLAFQAWQEHRLDRLRQERIEYEERLAGARSSLAAAHSAFARHSAQDVVVARARRELGLDDSPIGARTRVALPATVPDSDDPLLVRLAAGLDRFGGIRPAGAAEGER